MTNIEFRLAREKLNLSQEDVAEHIGLYVEAVNRWEIGESPVPESVARWLIKNCAHLDKEA